MMSLNPSSCIALHSIVAQDTHKPQHIHSQFPNQIYYSKKGWNQDILLSFSFSHRHRSRALESTFITLLMASKIWKFIEIFMNNKRHILVIGIIMIPNTNANILFQSYSFKLQMRRWLNINFFRFYSFYTEVKHKHDFIQWLGVG